MFREVTIYVKVLVRFQYSYREIDAGLPCKKQGAAWCGGFSPADTLATAWSHGGSAVCNSALNKLFQWEERWKTNYHHILPAVKLRRVVLGSNSGEQWLMVCWFDFFSYSATVTTWTSRMTKDYAMSEWLDKAGTSQQMWSRLGRSGASEVDDFEVHVLVLATSPRV